VNNNNKEESVTHQIICATWSENQEHSEWEVNLVLEMEAKRRKGFLVQSDGESGVKNLKSYSRHEIMDIPTFTRLLNKGNKFNKLQLFGEFFNNADFNPPLEEDDTPKSPRLERISAPNLKTLVIRLKLPKDLKEEGTLDNSSFKRRAAQNVVYLLEALECPELSTIDIMDTMDWKDSELKECGFYYWSSPLINFLQRHAPTLVTLKTSPLICSMQQESAAKFNSVVPALENLLFWIKLHTNEFNNLFTDESNRERGFQKELNAMLSPWEKFLQGQWNLKTLVWISDGNCPWNFTRREFLHLCQDNPSLESLMIAVHGEKKFREGHDLPEQPYCTEDFEINAAAVHGMTSLRILSIGCFQSDPQKDLFTFTNLQLLPRSLETVQLLGVGVIGSEIEKLTELPNLRNLTIVQGKHIVYTEQDKVNGNVSGVTGEALKKLITNSRSLDKLVIVGFPMEGAKFITKKTSEKIGWFR
jgi:hypothetical protein